MRLKIIRYSKKWDFYYDIYVRHRDNNITQTKVYDYHIRSDESDGLRNFNSTLIFEDNNVNIQLYFEDGNIYDANIPMKYISYIMHELNN